MTLRELFIPNKYGTIPIIDILGIGTITYNPEGYATLRTTHTPEHCIVSLDTTYTKNMDSYLVVQLEDIRNLTSMCRYLVPMTPENYLIHNAIKPIASVFCLYNGTLVAKSLSQYMVDNLLNDGSGWTTIHGEQVPVTFYIADILYRLDLQGELK